MDRGSWPSAAVVLLALVCSGCGAAAKSPTATVPMLPPGLVSAERVAGEQPDSAQRALLSWWRAVQFRDVESALRLTDATAIRSIGGVRAFRAAVQEVGDSLPGVVISESVEVSPNRLALRALIVFYDDRGRTAGRSPLSFSMWRTSRGWQLHDLSLLQDQAAGIRKARARASR
jgi:hypothetical protein